MTTTLQIARSVEIKPRRVFRTAGELTETVAVESGIVALFKADGVMRRRIVGLRYAGELIFPGVDCSIEPIVPSTVTLTADSDMDSAPVMHQLIRDARIATEWLLVGGQYNATERVAHFLCETIVRMGPDLGGAFIFPFTQLVMAEITGQTSVNVNRVMRDLDGSGVIARPKPHELVVKDWDELRRMASFSGAYLEYGK